MTKAIAYGLVCLLCCASAGFGGPLQTAQQLVTGELSGYKYGSSGAKRIDCVQFVAKVVSNEVGRTLTTTERTAILIADLPEANVQEAVEQDDPRIRGVQRAAVDLMQVATVVEPKSAAAGDLIQYWMKGTNDLWFGHAGIISRVWTNGPTARAAIVGAHASPKPDGIIGESDFGGVGLNLTGPKRKLFVARWK